MSPPTFAFMSHPQLSLSPILPDLFVSVDKGSSSPDDEAEIEEVDPASTFSDTVGFSPSLWAFFMYCNILYLLTSSVLLIEQKRTDLEKLQIEFYGALLS
jgi:hypothetical protein